MRLAVRFAHAWSIGASLLLLLILPPTFSLAHSSAQPQPASQVLAPSDLVSNGRFVLGPRALDFDAAAYLQHRNSPLLPDAALIEAACAYASVNPQLVLTLLEFDGRQVTQGWRSALPPSSAKLWFSTW